MDAAELRRAMVDHQIARRGVRDPRVLDAMGAVPRERFVPGADPADAYDDHAMAIGSGQTISQPYVVAVMAEAAELDPSSRVLEVGTGSGYGAAVLGQLAAEVWTLERHGALADSAREALAEVGATNVHVIHGDGVQGWPDEAPFDAIVVTAAGHAIPPPLLEQLVDGGRLVMPVGPSDGQQLLRLRRRGDTFATEDCGAVRFVPLLPAVTA